MSKPEMSGNHAKRSAQEAQIPDVLPNMTQQSRVAATGGLPPSTQVVKKTVGKIFEVASTVVKQGATQAKNLVSEKVVVHLADVLVIGGGLSGLTAAESILEMSKTLKVFVIESSDRLGGRIKTDILHVGNSSLAVDSGGSWISRKDHPTIVRMCERFGTELVDQYGNKQNEGRHVIVSGPETRRSYVGNIPAYSLFSVWEIQFRVLSKVEALAKKIPLDNPWTLPEAADLDRESVASFFAKRLRMSTSKKVVESTVMHLFGCSASQISLLHFLYTVRCSGGLVSKLLSTEPSDGCFGTRMLGGAQQLCEKLADTIKSYDDGHVESGVRVVQIRARSPQSDHPIVVTTSDHKKYLVRALIIAACPSTFVNQCAFVPRLPLSFQRFGSVSFRGAIARAILIYPGPWWRGASFSGFARNTNPLPSQCVSVVYDYCGMQLASDGTRGRDGYAIVCLILGDFAVEVGNWPESKRQESVLASLALMFPEQIGLSSTPLSYHDYFPMRQDPYAKGGPSTISPPGQFCEYSAARLLRKPLCHSRDSEHRPVIFFSSTESSNSYPGTMEGACARGKEVAMEVNNVLAQIGRKRAGGGENDTDAFFQEEENGGVVVLEDDVWTAAIPPSNSNKRRIPH